MAAPYQSTSTSTPLSTYAASAPSSSQASSSIFRPLTAAIDRLAEIRDSLALPHPGTAENFGREVKNVHLINYAFEGARADLMKMVGGVDKVFQVTHQFALGGQTGPMGGTNPGTYNFGAVFSNEATLLTGNIDNEGGVTGRYQYGWAPVLNTLDNTRWGNVIKSQFQLAPGADGQSQVVLDFERNGKDYAANFKAFNPSPADLTGAYSFSYLQSVTKNLSLGVDGLYQRAPTGMEDASLGYMAKYVGSQRDWIGTLQILPQGLWQTTYWRKLAEAVEAGVDLLVIPADSPRERKAIATAGVKYDYRQATFRAQVDSTGKVATFLEQRMSPAFAFLLSGEIDHVKNTSKFGVGIMMSSSPQEEEMMAAAAAAEASGAYAPKA